MNHTLKTGIKAFDDATGGITLGGVNCISGLAGTGKSKILLEVANGLTKQGTKCLFLSNDVPRHCGKNMVTIFHNIYKPSTIRGMVEVAIQEEQVDVVCIDDISSLASSPAYDTVKNLFENLRMLNCTIITTTQGYKRAPDFESVSALSNAHMTVADMVVFVHNLIPFDMEKEQFVAEVETVKNRHNKNMKFHMPVGLLEG